MTDLILFYDTETTGLLKRDRPVDHPDQPALAQLAMYLATDAGEVVAEFCGVVKPDGWTIPDAAAEIHGITTEIADRVGLPAQFVTTAFWRFREIADFTVCHNLHFDEEIMTCALSRVKGGAVMLPKLPSVCTMEATTDLLKLPKPKGKGYKWPTLEELWEYLFETKHAGHVADADAKATMLIYFELKKRGLI